MLERVRLILQHNCQVVANRPLLVGVSGGPDSLCLLDLLLCLGFQVVVAHFNHLLRSESTGEARYVQALAAQLDVPYVEGSQDVTQYAQDEGFSVEEAARELRYRFLFVEAGRCLAQAVAVAHTADDQVETVLMHLLRGGATDGLSGMAYRSLPNPWSNEIPLVRPLLALWREEVLDYNAKRKLQPSIDASNLDRTYFRNRLRHEIIPALEQYQPNLRRLVWRAADVISEERRVLDSLVETAWMECVPEQGTGYLALDGQAMNAQPKAVQRRLLRRAIAWLHPGLRDVDYEAVERGLAFITSPQNNGQCDLVAGLFLLKEGRHIWLAAQVGNLPKASWPQLAAQENRDFNLPGKIVLPDGWILQSSVFKKVSQEREGFLANTDPFQAWFDADMLPATLAVRGCRPGERIELLGMERHSTKISDLFVNLKIPQRLRSNWPLVCAGEEIIWVPGLRQSNLARVTDKTRRVVRLALTKSDTS